MRRVLVIAAMHFEAKAIVSALGGVVRASGPIVRGAVKRSATEYQILAGGPGIQGARRALDMVRSKPDVVVSAGICGGLDSGLDLYEVVAATEVNGIECRLPVSSKRFHRGVLVSVDRVVASVDERRRLAVNGALAVDMEAAAVAEYARSMGVPLSCIKTVSDAFDEEFSLDLNAARDTEGRFRAAAIFGQALYRPWSGIPEMLRLKRRGEEASRRLGEFFADCYI